jgi:serpin B
MIMRKKIIAIILTVAMVLSLAIPASTTVTEPKASIQDALDILKFLAKLDSPVTGNATIEDALDILKYLARLDSIIGGQIPVRVPQPVVTTPVTPALTPGQFTEFAPALLDLTVDVFKRSFAQTLECEHTESPNAMVSPLSVLLALAMTANGADGQTLAEMEAVLGRGIKSDDLNLMLKTYTDNLPSAEGSKLNIANSIWIKDTPFFVVLDKFLNINKQFYNAEIITAPFNGDTVDAINQWVSDNTDEMITEVLEFIDPDTMMYLINAIVFDSQWENQYEEKDISKRNFTAFDGSVQNTDFMYSKEESFIETDNATGFIKQYAGGHYSFAALLPNEGVSIEEFIAGMSAENLANALKSAYNPESGVHAFLPKFSFEYEIIMNELLSSMGMPTAFDESNADFSRMSSLPLFIGMVLHKTFIEVDEVGTKAAAVTVVEMQNRAAPAPAKTVMLNRPFVFAIVDNSTDLPIFIGTLMEVPS